LFVRIEIEESLAVGATGRSDAGSATSVQDCAQTLHRVQVQAILAGFRLKIEAARAGKRWRAGQAV
jgi:hypothetical protein